MVNYSNFALAMTTTRTVTKLDDDHLAIPERSPGGGGAARDGRRRRRHVQLFRHQPDRRSRGGLAIPGQDPLSGSGDIGFFDVTDRTVFTHDRRFEEVPRPAGRRRFCGFLYWHLKYLKAGLGFANYDLEANPDSRFARRKARLEARPGC